MSERPGTMDMERVEELAALVASGGASAGEQAELARAVEQDEEAAEVAAEYLDAAALLADELPAEAPPAEAFPRVRDAVAAAAEEGGSEADGPAPRPSELHPETRKVISMAQKRAARAAAFATFAFAAAAAFAFMWYRARGDVGQLRDEVRQLSNRGSVVRADLLDRLEQEKQQRKQLEQALARAEERYGPLKSPRLRLATMQSDAGEGVAKIFVDDQKRRWVVFAFELPQVPDKDYQLWFVPPDGTPVSAGLLERAEDGTLMAAPEVPADVGLEDVKAAISLEPKGGSKTPTMDQIKMIGDLI